MKSQFHIRWVIHKKCILWFSTLDLWSRILFDWSLPPWSVIFFLVKHFHLSTLVSINLNNIYRHVANYPLNFQNSLIPLKNWNSTFEIGILKWYFYYFAYLFISISKWNRKKSHNSQLAPRMSTSVLAKKTKPFFILRRKSRIRKFLGRSMLASLIINRFLRKNVGTNLKKMYIQTYLGLPERWKKLTNLVSQSEFLWPESSPRKPWKRVKIKNFKSKKSEDLKSKFDKLQRTIFDRNHGEGRHQGRTTEQKINHQRRKIEIERTRIVFKGWNRKRKIRTEKSSKLCPEGKEQTSWKLILDQRFRKGRGKN